MMKRAIYLCLFSLCWLTSVAQSVELMRMYTDKECYLAGEELWVKVCVDDEALPGNGMSRVAYVEICDTAQVRAQAKVALTDGTGWACIRLPQTMHSGMYQLSAYTRYMRNWQSDCFPRKPIAVLNVRSVSDEDRLVRNDSSALQKEEVAVSAHRNLVSDRKVYGLRDKVSLEWSPEWKDARELTLSVVRKDCEVQVSQLESASPEPAQGKRWVAECEGHIVSARVVGDDLPASLLTQLSCVGKEMQMYEGKKKSEGLYRFYTHGVTNQQDIVLSAQGNDGKAFRMELESPFAELLPDALPPLHCWYQDSALIARSVALQLTQALPKAVLPKKLEERIYGQLPSKTYNLDEYVRFNTVEECMVEFVMGTAIDRKGDQKVIRMLQEDAKDFSLLPVLVLVDGVAFYNHSEVLGYNARQVQYIHQYRGNFALGESFYGGILSLITHRGAMPDMRINDDMQMLAYEFPQDRPVFGMPEYGNPEVKASRRPDFRHTLYWAPAVQDQEKVTFYTSDLAGTYVATLQGISADGKKVEVKCEFEVK
jgi:hypothetical protein